MERQSDESQTSGKIQCLIYLLSCTHVNVHHFYGFNYKDPVADDKSCRKLQNKVQNNFGSLDAHSGKHEFLIAKIIRKLQAEFSIITLTTTPSLLFLRNHDYIYTLQERYLNSLVIGLGHRFQLFYLAFQFIKKAFGGL